MKGRGSNDQVSCTGFSQDSWKALPRPIWGSLELGQPVLSVGRGLGWKGTPIRVWPALLKAAAGEGNLVKRLGVIKVSPGLS